MSNLNLGLAIAAVATGLSALALASWDAANVVEFSVRQEVRDDLPARLEAAVQAVKLEEGLPNLVAGVWLGGERVLASTVARDERGQRESVHQGRSALWAVEPLAALALLRMVDSEKLELGDPLTKHFPTLTFGGKTVSVGQVLTHSSGVPSYVDFLASQDGEFDGAKVLAWLSGRPLDAEPGSCFAYSESNALIAAALVEKLSGKPAFKALTEWVVDAVGLKSTEIDEGRRGRGPQEASYRIGGSPVDVASVARLVGIGRIQTTLEDLAELMQAVEGDGFFSDQVRSLLIRADRLPAGIEAPYSFGFSRSRFERSPTLALGGASQDGSIKVAWRPETSLVVALASRAATADLSVVVDRLVRVVQEIPERTIVDLPLTAEQCEVYSGVYYMGCTRTTIEKRDKQLFFQSPYDGPYRLRFQGHDVFVAANDDEVVFEFKVENGQASEYVLSQHGSRTGAVRMK